MPGLILCGGRTSKYRCDSSENDILTYIGFARRIKGLFSDVHLMRTAHSLRDGLKVGTSERSSWSVSG